MRLSIEIGNTNQLEQFKPKEIEKIYQQLFNCKEGKIILEDLASMSGMYRTNFVADNSNHTIFLEGQRSLFLYICSHLGSDDINNIQGGI